MKALNPVLFFAGIAYSLVLTSCGNDTKPVAAENTHAKIVTRLPEPFRFHKAIEVKPGLTFDVVSWGRGSTSEGALMILRSDSTHIKYRSVSNELDGKILDAWNMDMDSDGNPEIFIQAKGEGEGSHFSMYVYEFDNSGSANELRFPDLTSATKKQYRGLDSIYIKDGRLRRQFPLFKEEDQTKPSGEKKVLEYRLRSNNFTVEDVTEEKEN